jgi:hypothetical protein
MCTASISHVYCNVMCAPHVYSISHVPRSISSCVQYLLIQYLLICYTVHKKYLLMSSCPHTVSPRTVSRMCHTVSPHVYSISSYTISSCSVLRCKKIGRATGLMRTRRRRWSVAETRHLAVLPCTFSASARRTRRQWCWLFASCAGQLTVSFFSRRGLQVIAPPARLSANIHTVLRGSELRRISYILQQSQTSWKIVILYCTVL